MSLRRLLTNLSDLSRCERFLRAMRRRIRSRDANDAAALFRASRYESFEERLAFSVQGVCEFLTDGIHDDSLLHLAAQATTSTPSTATVDYGLDYVRSTYGFLGAGQTVAIIDSGIAYDHSALGGGFGAEYRVVGGWDFAENDADPYDDAPGGFHGTHIAGILGSSDPAHRGVAPEVDLVALRVFDDHGQAELAWVEQALRWVHQHRNDFANPITVVNLSLGGGENAIDVPSEAQLEDELSLLDGDGIFIAVSAGNSFAEYASPGLNYPASSPHVTPVASVGPSGRLSDFSQRSPRVIAAPGERITSTVPDFAFNLDGVTNDFERSSGTSMATPYVAGAAVLVREAMQSAGRADITSDAIYDVLYDSADLVFDLRTSASYHRINVGRAIDAVMPADPVPVDWGSIAFSEFADQSLPGEAWRTLRATRSGLLTVEAFFAHVAGNVDLELYDAGGVLLGASRSMAGSERIDVTVAAGQTVSLKVIGANADVDFRLANLVQATNGVLDIFGTSGNDRFSFTAGSQRIIEVNGVRYAFPAEQLQSVRFRGDRGSDAISLLGSAGDERLTTRPGSFTFSGSAWTVTAIAVEQLTATGEGGHDTAVLRDSRGDDRYVGGEDESRLIGTGFDHSVAGFDSIKVRAGDGNDMATLTGSAGDDVFVARPDQASLAGAGFNHDVFHFDGVRATAGRGTDEARFYDGAGSDWFFARPDMAWMSGPGYLNFAVGFDEVRADATAGYDLAWLFDSRGDDRLQARLGEVRLVGGAFDNSATGFDATRAASVAGGRDRAEFFRARGDQFSLARGDAVQRGGGYMNMAFNFERVDEARLTRLRQLAFTRLNEERDSIPEHSRGAGLRALGHVFEEYDDEMA